MMKQKPQSNLVKSWDCLSKLTTYSKEHFIVFRFLDRGVTRYLSIKKFSQTRWIGLILQAEKLIKVEDDVKSRANGAPSLGEIVNGLD